MSDEKLGIEELKDVINGAVDISALLVKHLKDGLQLSKDVPALIEEVLGSEALKSAIGKLISGISKVPSEVKDLDLSESGELVGLLVQKVQIILDALKTEAPQV